MIVIFQIEDSGLVDFIDCVKHDVNFFNKVSIEGICTTWGFLCKDLETVINDIFSSSGVDKQLAKRIQNGDIIGFVSGQVFPFKSLPPNISSDEFEEMLDFLDGYSITFKVVNKTFINNRMDINLSFIHP
jgi:hypothetical protein